MNSELIDFFISLYKQDYQLIKESCHTLSDEQIWKATPEGVSVANLICHVCEMETYWIDHGLFGDDIVRHRQQEFDRNQDLTKIEISERITNRNQKTLERLNHISDEQWLKKRDLHGDQFTGQGILLWHIHHLGLHRGHIQAHTRWLASSIQ